MLPYSRLMLVVAHPDDANVIAGGLAAAARLDGIDVATVCLTRGGAGYSEPDWPSSSITYVRTAEQLAADAVLDIWSTEFLDCIDGQLEELSLADGVSKLVPSLLKFDPEVVITFGADGFTLHPDHIKTSRLTAQAVRQSGLKDVQVWNMAVLEEMLDLVPTKACYQGRRPRPYSGELVLDYHLPPAILALKRRAIEAHLSQAKSLAYLNEWIGLGREAFFRVV